MPFLTIQTSASEFPNKKQFLKDLSKELANILGKNEKYVMTSIINNVEMTFSGDDLPACYIEIKSIGGLNNDNINKLNTYIFRKIKDNLGISSERTYINFVDVPRTSWGWHGTTF